MTYCNSESTTTNDNNDRHYHNGDNYSHNHNGSDAATTTRRGQGESGTCDTDVLRLTSRYVVFFFLLYMYSMY